ncbi:MAG: hypothetical protein P8L85_02040 [Rubripirellula sp.]|nr:hypothetical protein [Rubripirellula sp.]
MKQLLTSLHLLTALACSVQVSDRVNISVVRVDDIGSASEDFTRTIWIPGSSESVSAENNLELHFD